MMSAGRNRCDPVEERAGNFFFLPNLCLTETIQDGGRYMQSLSRPR